MVSRAIAWIKEDPAGAEFADVMIQPRRLTATGTAIGSAPVGYRLDYKLETLSNFVTSGLLVTARGEGCRRKLDLRSTRAGKWSIRATADGLVALPGRTGRLPTSRRLSTAISVSRRSPTRCRCCATTCFVAAGRSTF